MKKDEVWVDFVTFDAADEIIRGKLKVPDEIVASRDCKKFTEWQFNTLPMPMHGLCPWYEYKPIYEVYIGDMLLHIPRKYMLLPNETDVKTNLISTNDFIYPTLEPMMGKHPDSFWFTLHEDEKDNRFDNRLQRFFWSFYGVHEAKDKNKRIIKKVGFHEKLGISQYTLLRRGDDPNMIRGTFYSNDDPDNIQDFIACYGKKENNQCKSFFKYKNIYVEYMAEKHLFYKPNDLRSAVIKLIKQWEVTTQPSKAQVNEE